MEIRKLESAEHGKTRFLWEKIFKEDSQTFYQDKRECDLCS